MILPHWIYVLERKFGFIKIPYLGVCFAVLQAVGIFFSYKDPSFVERMSLVPSAVLQGEFYRLLSFLLIPLNDSILTFLFLWFIIFVVQILERHWGSFKVTLYFVLGLLGAILGAFLFQTTLNSPMLLECTFFLALASIMPDFKLLLFFILPIRMKWVGIAFAIVLVLQLVLFGAWQMVLCLLFSCINYVLFFGVGFCKFLTLELKKRRAQ